MKGSHWCATYAKDNVINYFDSFGLTTLSGDVNHAKRENVTLITSESTITKPLYIDMWILLFLFS